MRIRLARKILTSSISICGTWTSRYSPERMQRAILRVRKSQRRHRRKLTKLIIAKMGAIGEKYHKAVQTAVLFGEARQLREFCGFYGRSSPVIMGVDFAEAPELRAGPSWMSGERPLPMPICTQCQLPVSSISEKLCDECQKYCPCCGEIKCVCHIGDRYGY